MRIFILIICLITLSCQSYAKWEFDESNNSIYTIFKTKDGSGWNVYVILAVEGDKFLFSATVPFSEYKEIFTFNPPPVLNYKGIKLVKHDTFFWGKKGNSEKIKIDGKEYWDFHKNIQTEFQIVSNDGAYSKLVKAFKAGNSIILDKHYWQLNKKKYPSFSLVGFTKAYNEHIKGNELSIKTIKDYDLAGLKCAKHGARKIVWIETSHGTYALNGQAITWLETSKSIGKPFLGKDGNEWKMGRDYIEHSKLSSLIYHGLKKCD